MSTTALSAAVVQPLDGPVLSGTAVTFGPGAVVLDGRSLPLASVDWIDVGSGQPTTLSARLGLWLADGGWLPAFELLPGDGPDRIRARTVLGTVELPLQALRGWSAGDLLSAAPAGDRILVAAGQVDGRLVGLVDGRLRFASSIDPEPLSLALAEVQGLRLGDSPAAPRSPLSLTVELAPDRPPLRLVIDGQQRLVLGGTTAAIDVGLLGGLHLRVDGPGSRRVFLSDLDPQQVDEQGCFGTVWPWRRDQDLDGGPLRLAGRRWAKGVTLHAAGTWRWNLGRSYQRLTARIGIADGLRPEGDCQVIVRADGRVVWERRVTGTEPAGVLDLPVEGVAALAIEVALGERYDIGDHLVLADAWLVRRP